MTENIVGPPSPEMKIALLIQKHLQQIIRERENAGDTDLMMAESVSRSFRDLQASDSLAEILQGIQFNTGLSVVTFGRNDSLNDVYPQEIVKRATDYVYWSDRFNREGHIFEENETILVSAFVEIDVCGSLVLVTDDKTGRMADRFYLKDVSDKEKIFLEQYRGVALFCFIKILCVRNEESPLSDIHQYDAFLESELIVPPINPSIELLEQLSPGTRVIIEGRVISNTVESKAIDATRKIDQIRIVIETDDNKKVEFVSWAIKLEYAEGVVENVAGKPVEVEDRLRVLCYVEDRDGEKYLCARENKPFLIEPSSKKIIEYDRLRKSVSQEIEQLSESISLKQYSKARQLFALLRTKDLAISEAQRVLFLMSSAPDQEKPIYDGQHFRQYWATRIDNAYGVLIESMTRSEFVQFVREIGTGRREALKGKCDPSDAFYIMEINGIGVDTMLSVFPQIARERLKRLDAITNQKDDYQPDQYMLKQALEHVAFIDSPISMDIMMEMIRFLIDSDYFDKREKPEGDSECPRQYIGLLQKCTSLLASFIQRFPENLQLIDNGIELESWLNKIESFSFCFSSYNMATAIRGF